MNTNNILKIAPGAINDICDTLISCGAGGKILYVSDPVVDSLYGDKVKVQLKEIGRVKQEIISENTIAFAMACAERVIATDIDTIVAVGGGRVLDVCKYAAYIAKRPLLSIPTTMANDGIASPIAVLKRQDNKPKSLSCEIPTMLLLDTELVLNSPIELIKAGIGDTISNRMALLDWEYACDKKKDRMNGYAHMMSKNALDVLMNAQYTSIGPEFIDVLANSHVLSGVAMDFAKSSRPVSGSEHLFSHALDYYGSKQNLHGIQVALGTIAMLKLIGMEYDGLVDYLDRFEVCVNPLSLGIDEETFVLCMQKASSMRPNRYTHLNDISLDNERLKVIYKQLISEL